MQEQGGPSRAELWDTGERKRGGRKRERESERTLGSHPTEKPRPHHDWRVFLL